MKNNNDGGKLAQVAIQETMGHPMMHLLLRDEGEKQGKSSLKTTARSKDTHGPCCSRPPLNKQRQATHYNSDHGRSSRHCSFTSNQWMVSGAHGTADSHVNRCLLSGFSVPLKTDTLKSRERALSNVYDTRYRAGPMFQQSLGREVYVVSVHDLIITFC